MKIGFFGLVSIILLIAKLTGHFAYSWFWVFCPLFVGFGITIFIWFVIFVLACFAEHSNQTKFDSFVRKNRGLR